MTKSPLVSVLMTVYNAERYLREAIDSILRQDFTDFEFIIINDGSSDESQAIVNEYAKRDNRIVSVVQKNHGLVYSLNKGIKLARGTYIARMDSDDVCMDGRLTAQVAFLEANPEVVLLGGGFEVMDERGWYIATVHPPTDHEDIVRTMLLRNPFGHASAMYRKKTVVEAGLYSDAYGPTEDYELWMRMSAYGKIATLPSVLYRYRINSQGISASKAKIQDHYRLELLKKIWSTTTPQVIRRHQLRAKARSYLDASTSRAYGAGMRLQYLEDNAQIGVKMIKNKQPLQGAHQLLAVATTGRTGLGIVKSRLGILVRNSPTTAANIIRGRQDQLDNVDLPKTT